MSHECGPVFLCLLSTDCCFLCWGILFSTVSYQLQFYLLLSSLSLLWNYIPTISLKTPHNHKDYVVANCPTSTKSDDFPMFVSFFCKGYFERSRAPAFDDNDYNDNQAHHGDFHDDNQLCCNYMKLFKTTGIGNTSCQTKSQASSQECCYKIYPILSSCSRNTQYKFI